MTTKKAKMKNPLFAETEVTVIQDRLCIETIPVFMPGSEAYRESQDPKKEEVCDIQISIVVKLSPDGAEVKQINYCHDCYSKGYTQMICMQGFYPEYSEAKSAHDDKIGNLRELGIKNAWEELNSGMRKLREYGVIEGGGE
jgi:hypothetical protein